MDRATFEHIKTRHGGYASWAVWAQPDQAPMSNIADLSVLDPDRNSTLLDTLRSDVVMLGRSFSRPVDNNVRLTNFHDTSPHGNDFKIRYAFSGTPFYGGYMSNLIKGVIARDPAHLREQLKTDLSLVSRIIGQLLEEIDDLGCSQPLVIAFGADTYELASQSIPSNPYGQLVGVPSFGIRGSKEQYRESVHAKLTDALNPSP
jgi:hypothetical protein